MELPSPEGTYTASAYLNNGGATTSFAVLVTVKNNKTGWEKNIYWQNKCENAIMTWIDDKTISINGRTLNVERDVYDFRRLRVSY